MTTTTDQKIAELERRVAALERKSMPYQPVLPQFGYAGQCVTCGMQLSSVMAYVCPRGGDCPCGLGGASC
jgi:hypothetical protein